MSPRITIQGRTGSDYSTLRRSGNRLRELDRMPLSKQQAADRLWSKVIAILAVAILFYWLGGR